MMKRLFNGGPAGGNAGVAQTDDDDVGVISFLNFAVGNWSRCCPPVSSRDFRSGVMAIQVLFWD